MYVAKHIDAIKLVRHKTASVAVPDLKCVQPVVEVGLIRALEFTESILILVQLLIGLLHLTLYLVGPANGSPSINRHNVMLNQSSLILTDMESTVSLCSPTYLALKSSVDKL